MFFLLLQSSFTSSSLLNNIKVKFALVFLLLLLNYLSIFAFTTNITAAGIFVAFDIILLIAATNTNGVF